MGWFTSSQITFDENAINRFLPVSYSELRKNDSAIGMQVGLTESSLVIRTKNGDYSMTFPSIDTLEERIERSATLRKVDEMLDESNYETEYDW